MKNLLITLFFCFLSVAFIADATWANSKSAKSQITYEDGIQVIVKRIKQRYDMEFVYKNFNDVGIEGVSLSAVPKDNYKKLFLYMRLFEQEVNKYPISFFKNRNLKNIYFVTKLFYKDKATDGLYSFKENLIIFDYSRSSGFPKKQRHNIHHEFYHMIAVGNYTRQDINKWESFNIPSFQYANPSNVKYVSNEVNNFAPNKPGFLTNYSMTSGEEDRAEIFAALMIPSQHRILNKWAQKDSILRKKRDFMKKFITNFCDGMNEQFWNILLRRK